ncbi:DUF4129 domain-containing protein [Telmatobacter sp. DSM 110680]|uniref:DUF4129 domain-containing protein n=1 Tax=Telmatobacter sp. DSM 110680 TaxID=3036704 RepID=A0AAU7DJG4_9BACT
MLVQSVRLRAVFVAMAITAIACAQTSAPPQTGVRWHDVSLDDYRQHLKTLSVLVDTCEGARNLKNCDPALVGQDDRVDIARNSHPEQRLVRYGWLRALLSKAKDPDPPTKSTSPGGPKSSPQESTTSQILKAAKARLESDLAQASAPAASYIDHAQQRAAMQQVLASAEFRDLQKPSVRDSAFEKFGNWLNHLFESAANFKARSAWIGRALVWGFIIGVCVALVYSLLRLERRWRIHLVPEGDRPAPGAPSARDWQLWLEDARRAAASGLWREAIHFVYWAAISRLESRRLWPADRARTPREYLSLVAPQDPRKPGLSQLTSSFERFWYGGRVAAESDYKSAESLASTLISGGTSVGTSEASPLSEGGVR